MTKKIKNIIILAAIATCAIVLFFWLGAPKKNTEISKGQIKDVKTLAQLCTVDLYNEVPVLDTINNKVLFAVQKQRGSVSFDLENMQVNTDGDTVKIVLSPEIVEINEATEDNSWQVIDDCLGKIHSFGVTSAKGVDFNYPFYISPAAHFDLL